MRKLRMGKRGGFSLIVVLIISLIGLTVIAVSLQMAAATSGNSRASSGLVNNYNLLSSELENARAILRERMSTTSGDAPRYFHPGGGAASEADNITSLDNLIIPDGVIVDRALSAREIREYGLEQKSGGNDWRIAVRIYDMQYEPERLAGMAVEDARWVPPSVILIGSGEEPPLDAGGNPLPPITGTGPAVNAGSYLIRASFEIDDQIEHTIEMALTETTKKTT
ncbi:MAG: hypothetical protein LBT23_12470 [Synergistaceae bacterium]|jgi:hypothetical protein|nr:hypothetical protein [Synergistaceae bacterium]